LGIFIKNNAYSNAILEIIGINAYLSETK